MDAPCPVKIKTKNPDFMDFSEANVKYTFHNNGYILKLDLIEEYIYMIVTKNDDVWHVVVYDDYVE